MTYRIPFNRPFIAEKTSTYLTESLQSHRLAGDGPFTRRSHELLQQLHGAAGVLLTTSCTHALELAALLLDLQPGDEVIVPSFTFVSTVNAFVLRGARPVFCDIRPDTLNLDETRLPPLITPRTRAIVPVHYAGVGCAMASIGALADAHGIAVVEDNAHGLFGSIGGRPLGSFGRFAALSFHETKNISCGEGGALLLNDAADVARAEILREKGTDRSRFFRGEVDKYSWVDVGSSYLPSDLLAALLCAQLEQRERIQAARQRLWLRYEAGLRDWADAHGVGLPVVPVDCGQAYHMFYLLLPSLEQRSSLIAHLKQHGMLAVFHYLPLHLSAMGRRLGGQPGDCPVTEDVSDRLLRLPFFVGLTDAEQDEVIAAVRDFELSDEAK